MAVNWNLAGRPPSFAEMLQAGQSGQDDRRELDRQAARVAAGQAYVGGDKIGAARALAGAGEVSAAAGIVDDVDARGQADDEASRVREAKIWAAAIPRIKSAMRQPGGRATAADQLRLAAREAGATEEEESGVLEYFTRGGERYLDTLEAQAGTVLQEVGNTLVDVTDPSNPRAVFTAPKAADPLEDERAELIRAQTEAARAQVPLRAAQAERAGRPPAARSGGGGRGGGSKTPAPPAGFSVRVR